MVFSTSPPPPPPPPQETLDSIEPGDEYRPTVLQTGVGHGKTLQHIFQARGLNPIGIDISPRALASAYKRGLGVGQADMLTLPFADSSFDGVFEVGVVEHFATEDPFNGHEVDAATIVHALIEMRRVLRPGGKAAFIQPSRHSVAPLQKRLWQMVGQWDMGFQQDFGINPFLQLVELAGFRERKIAVMQAPDDFPLVVRWGDQALMTYYEATGQDRKADFTGALFAVVATNPDEGY